MKKFFCLLFLAAIAGCWSASPTTTLPSQTNDKPQSADSTAEASPNSADKIIVIDVRSKKEWDSGHVGQAIHIPHTEIAERISEVTNDKDAKIVVYCAVGGRAGQAKTSLEKLGFTNVENAGGYDDVKDRFDK
jgi:phage shock protein E